MVALRCMLLVLMAVVTLGALEAPPRSIVAVEGPEPQLRHEQRINGCAVLLTADGLAVTLAETLDPAADQVTVILPGGDRREAEVVVAETPSTAVLLRIPLDGDEPLEPVRLARSSALEIGAVTWTAGNSFGALESDGIAAISRGVVSGRYRIPPGHPPIRGRLGAVLSEYRGPVIETDAAVNDGDHGGALLDDAGRLLGLVSLGVARQRRLGSAVPIDRILADLSAHLGEPEQVDPTGRDPVGDVLAGHAERIAASMVLVYLERPQGPGNPQGMPRPSPISPALPRYEQERLATQWSRYYHQQQVFFTDQAVTALCVDADEGLLLTAASNLHGDAEGGFALLPDGSTVRCSVHAVHRQLDLAVLACEEPLNAPAITFAGDADLRTGDPVAVLGRHRDGGPFTMTTGIVSAMGRHFNLSPYPLIQTDALANYGSLGGVVVDLDGEAVGVVIMLAPNPQWRWYINSGIAMAVDGSVLSEVLPGLLDGESVETGSMFGLGINTEWLPEEQQIEVQGMMEGGGAADSDLEEGDRILSADGRRLEHPNDLKRAILKHRPGERIQLGVERAGKHLTVPVELRVVELTP